MWKAAFTGRSEKGGDKDRETTSVSGRPEVRRKKSSGSSRSTRGDVDDSASIMSGSSRRHRSSRYESSARYADTEERAKTSSRYEEDDRNRQKETSSFSAPPSAYGSAATYASPTSSSYATAPMSRVSAVETRPLTASALRMLPDEDDDEWEDDDKTARSERRSSAKKRSPSDEREKRRKGSGKSTTAADKEREAQQKRSSSRERKEKRKSSTTSDKTRDKPLSRRHEPEVVTESSRAIPAMASLEQFPGQYGGGGMMGQHQDYYTMSGALPASVPQSQFPGQDIPAPYEQAAPQVGITRADSYGHAADYYLDEGQSVAHQPGNRPASPNMLVNPDHHLMAASAVPIPAQDTGAGSAADFYNDTTSYSAPVTPAKPSAKPGKQSSFSATKPLISSTKPSKPSRTSSTGAVAAGLAGVAGVAALSKTGKNGKMSSSQQHSPSGGPGQTASASYQQRESTSIEYPPTVQPTSTQQRPSRHTSDASVYYASPPQVANASTSAQKVTSAYGISQAGTSAYGPNYENTYGIGNVPAGKTTNHLSTGLYATGAAAAGAAAYESYHHHHQHGQSGSNMATSGGFGGNNQGPPRPPLPTGYGNQYPSNGNSGGGMMQQGRFHEHKGPMTKLKDGLLNLISSPEDVAKMEMYTEYIGVCKYCFDPRTTAWDAPRVHHYHKRSDSFESLRRRVSRDRLLHKGSLERVDKESRYYASDSSRRRREDRHSGMGLASAGLAAVGTGIAANAIFSDRKNFDDTYSVKSGHRESSAVRRRSRSSSREKRRRSQYGTIRADHNEFVTVRRKDGTVEQRRVAKSRSRSRDRKASGIGIGSIAAAAALGAAGVAASSRRRSRSSSREHRRRSTRVSPRRSEHARHDRNDKRQSEDEGGGGIFGNFFSPSRTQRRNSRERQKKHGGFFTFSNGSSSSSNSELAFGGSFVSRNGSKTSLSRRSSGRSSRGRPQRKTSDQHLAATLAGIGATAAALGAAKAGHRISKRASRPELGARRQVRQQVVGDHRHGSPGSFEDEEWEDELPSDHASSVDGLAFGDYGDRRLSNRQSLESVASQSSAGGLGAWGWRWGGKDRKRRPGRSISAETPYTHNQFGSSIGPTGAGVAAGADSVFDPSRPVQSDQPIYLDDTGRPLPSVDARSSTSGASSQPLQYVEPRPLSEAGTSNQQYVPGAFDTPSRVMSMPGAFEPDDAPIYRPGPSVVQHPQPMSPARPAFTQPDADRGYTATAGTFDDRPNPRRTQSSPVQSSWGQDAALIGAGVLGAGAIIAGSAMSSGRKGKDSPSNVRFGLTEEQQRKESRSIRREDKRADDERRRSDRTRALKDEAERAAKESRQEEVLRAREAEIQARAQAQLDSQLEQERKEAEEARSRAEQRAREDRERQWEIERLQKEAADRQAAAVEANAEFERQRQAREDAERRRAEAERQSREREEAFQRQQYQLAEDARREDEQRRLWEAERYAREYQESAKKKSARDSREPASGRGHDNEDARQESSYNWGAVAAGAAAAAGVGAILAEREEKKSRRQSATTDSTTDTPISRRPPRTSVDWTADVHAEDRRAADQAELDRRVREQYGHASRGSVELKDGYAAAEIAPGSDVQGEPILDDDLFNPDFFMRSQHSPADQARHEDLARRAADKVVAPSPPASSPDMRPKDSYANFFADELKDVLAKKPGEKERSIQPDSDVHVHHVEDDNLQRTFTLRDDLGGKSKQAPSGVPRLNVIAPTPPPSSKTESTKGSVSGSPLTKTVDAAAERDESPESSKDSGKSDRSRSISWGEDKTHIYDVQTPESYQERDRDSYITSPDLRGVGEGVTAAAVATGMGAALHGIVAEDGNQKTTYHDDAFFTAPSKKTKKEKKKSKKISASHGDDADSTFLDDISSKDQRATSQDVPPERGRELPYRGNESSRTRKDNEREYEHEEGVEEVRRNPEATSPGVMAHPLYQQPFFDSVSDFSSFRAIESPGTEGAPPVRGFVEGETEEPTPLEERLPHVPGGFVNDEPAHRPGIEMTNTNDSFGTSGDTSKDYGPEDSAWQPPLSKKDKKKRDKEAKRAGNVALDNSEPSTSLNEIENVPEEQTWEHPESAAERKKREKEAKRTGSSGPFDTEPTPPVREPEESAWEPPLSAKERKKREKEAKRASSTFSSDLVTAVGERKPDVDAWEPPLSAKERKKREKAAKKAGIDPSYSEAATPIVESPKVEDNEPDEYFPSLSKTDKQKKPKPFDHDLERMASVVSGVSMPSWSGDTVVSDITVKPPSPEPSKSEQRMSEKEAKKSVSGLADVTDTILATGGIAAAASALHDSTEESTSGSTKKDKKKKKKKSKLGESTYDDPRDAPSSMPGGWESPEHSPSVDEARRESQNDVAAHALNASDRNGDMSESVHAAETTAVPEAEPWNEWSEPASAKKGKKKSKRSSVAFDNIPQVSSPLRSEVAWDDYVGTSNGTNGDREADSEAARSDPITVIERKTSDEGKSSRKSSKDGYDEAGQRISESPRDISPEDSRSVTSSADIDRESRRKSRRDEARRGAENYDQPEYAYETQSVTASEPADEEGRKKHKRRSRHEDDDTMSVSSGRRRSRQADDDDDTRSVASSRSRREKEESPSVKKEKKGIFGSLFSRKSSDALPLSKESPRDGKKDDDDDEERRRRKKKHRDSEYGDDDDDTRSVKSESHRRRHRSTDAKEEEDSRERRRRSTHDDDGKHSESGSRHHRRRRTNEDGESLARHESRESRSDISERPKHHRRRTDEDKYDSRDQSFLGSRVEELPPLPVSRPGSPSAAVERMEGRPLEAGFGTGLVSAAAVGVAAGVAANVLSREKKRKSPKKSPSKSPNEIGHENVSGQFQNENEDEDEARRIGPTKSSGFHEPLPSVAAHSFSLPPVVEAFEVNRAVEPEEDLPHSPAPVLEKPPRPVSIGRPGSSTTIPLRLPGHAPITFGVQERTKSFSSPTMATQSGSALASPATPIFGKGRHRRSLSSELTSGIMPLYLVERSRPTPKVEDTLPSLPSSKPSSRASSAHGSDEYESAREELSAASSPQRSRSRSLTLDTIGANSYRGDGDILDSQQTTPKASEWPQTAIPWSLPTSVGEKKERQVPQFYTWEDFARDEKMHEQQGGGHSAVDRDRAGLAGDLRSRSKSPSKAKALAAAAMLGTAAVYTARRVKDRSPERPNEPLLHGPLPSVAAHSYPLPYVPAPEPAEQEHALHNAESPRQFEEKAPESVSSSKKSKKKSKKGKIQQMGVNKASAEAALPLTQLEEDAGAQAADQNIKTGQAQSESHPENVYGSPDDESVHLSSMASHTHALLPLLDLTEPSPPKESVAEILPEKPTQAAEIGYLASAAAHSMPVYTPPETIGDVPRDDDDRPSTACKLLPVEADSHSPALEQLSVQVEPVAPVEVEPIPQLTRKQSKKDKKKDKKKAKTSSTFEDEQRAQDGVTIAEKPFSREASIDRDVEVSASAPHIDFGLSEFAAVAGAAANAWSISQADAFRDSMQNVEKSAPAISLDTIDAPAGMVGDAQSLDASHVASTAVDEEPVSANTISKKEKKKKKKSKQSSTLLDDQGSSEKLSSERVAAQPIEEAAESIESLHDHHREAPVVEPDIQDWAPSSFSQKKGKKDRKKRLSVLSEPEVEMPPADASEQQGPFDDLPRGTDDAEQTPAAEPADNASLPASMDAVDRQASAPTLGPETVDDSLATISTKKSRKDRKKKGISWVDDTVPAPESEISVMPLNNDLELTENIKGISSPASPDLTEPISEQQATVEVAPQNLAAATVAESTPADDVAPAVPKKQSKRDKKKSKLFSWDEPEDSRHFEVHDATENTPMEDVIASQDEGASSFIEPSPAPAMEHENDGDFVQMEQAEPQQEEESSTSAVLKKQTKKDKKKKKQANSWAARPSESPPPTVTDENDKPRDGHSTEDSTDKETAFMTATAATAAAASLIPAAIAHDRDPSASETILADEDEVKPDADDPWTGPESSESSKRANKDGEEQVLDQSEPATSTSPPEPIDKPAGSETMAADHDALPATQPIVVGEETPPVHDVVPIGADMEQPQASDVLATDADMEQPHAMPITPKTAEKDKPEQRELDSSEPQTSNLPPTVNDESGSPERMPADHGTLPENEPAIVRDETTSTREKSPDVDVEKPQADGAFEMPSTSKKAKKAKKDKRMKQALDGNEWQPAIPESRPDDHSPRIEAVPAERTASLVNGPAEADDEKPTPSRKQSKKDKRKQKAQSRQVESELEVERDTPAADVATLTVANEPANESSPDVDRALTEEVSPPVDTPDNSFHDAEDFFDESAVAEPWHDAEETAGQTDNPQTIATEELSPQPHSPAEAVADIEQGHEQLQKEINSVAEDFGQARDEKMQDSPADPVQDNNLVDDVFGIVSDTGELNPSQSNEMGDREEVMADRGMEFEPERASEDMDAFGEPSPRDAAEWSLTSSKKTGKKGKKGRKSISKGLIKSESNPSSSANVTERGVPESAVPDLLPSESAPAIDTVSGNEMSDKPPSEESKDFQDQSGLPLVEAEPTLELPEGASAPAVGLSTSPGTDEVEFRVDSDRGDSDLVHESPQGKIETHNSQSEETKEQPTADVEEEFSWAPSSKKKKKSKNSKQGKQSTLEPKSAPDALREEGIMQQTAGGLEVPLGLTADPDLAGEDPTNINRDLMRRVEAPPSSPEEQENFATAPVSKKDKKKAKKVKGLGTRTQRTIEDLNLEEPMEQVKEHDPAIPESESAQDLATEPANIPLPDEHDDHELGLNNDGHGAPADNDIPVMEDASNTDQRAADANNGVAEELQEPADSSWSPSRLSKKSKKGKKARKSITEEPSADDVHNESDRKDRDGESEPLIGSAHGVGSAAATALTGLLSTTQTGETPPTEEENTNVEEAADGVAGSSGSGIRGIQGETDSNTGPRAADNTPVDTTTEPEAETSAVPDTMEETSHETTTAKPISDESLPRLATEKAEDEGAVPVGRKKKGRKSKQNVSSDLVEEQRMESADDGKPGETAHDSLDMPVAQELGPDARHTETPDDRDSKASREDITKLEAEPQPEPEPQHQLETERTAQTGMEDVATTTPEVPLIEEHDEWSGPPSKKKKAKRGKQPSLSVSAEPPAEEVGSEAQRVSVEESTNEASREVKPDEPVKSADDAEDICAVPSSGKKKKKAKKDRKSGHTTPQPNVADLSPEIVNTAAVAHQDEPKDIELAPGQLSEGTGIIDNQSPSLERPAIAGESGSDETSKAENDLSREGLRDEPLSATAESVIEKVAEQNPGETMAPVDAAEDPKLAANAHESADVNTAEKDPATKPAEGSDDWWTPPTSKKQKKKSKKGKSDFSEEVAAAPVLRAESLEAEIESEAARAGETPRVDAGNEHHVIPEPQLEDIAGPNEAALADETTTLDEAVLANEIALAEEASSPQEEASSAKEEASLPKEEVALLQEEVSSPKEAESLPKEEASSPQEEVALPQEEASLPKEEASLPQEEASLPQEEPALPKEEASLPKEEASSSKEEADLPKEEPALPKEEASSPQEEIALLQDEASLPKEEASLPQEEPALPKEEASLPKEEASSSKEEADLPKEEPALPKEEASSPQEEIALLQDEASLPKEEASSAQEEPALPQEEASLPKEEASLPKEEASSPQEEIALLQDEASLPKEEACSSKEEADLPKEEALPNEAALPSEAALPTEKALVEGSPTPEADETLTLPSKKKSKKGKKTKLSDVMKAKPGPVEARDSLTVEDMSLAGNTAESVGNDTRKPAITDDADVVVTPPSATPAGDLRDPLVPGSNDLHAEQGGNEDVETEQKSIPSTYGDAHAANDDTAVPDESISALDDLAPQSTATTSQEPKEAEPEDFCSLPIKTKKAKKGKKLQATVSPLDKQPHAESQDSRPDHDASTSEAQPAEEDTPAARSGKKGKKAKKAKRASEPEPEPEIEQPVPVIDAKVSTKSAVPVGDHLGVTDVSAHVDDPDESKPEQHESTTEQNDHPTEQSPSREEERTPEARQPEAQDDLATDIHAGVEPQERDPKVDSSVAGPHKEVDDRSEARPEAEPEADDSTHDGVDATIVGGAAAAATAIASSIFQSESRPETDEWTASSTKRSKKDKKKARKSGALTSVSAVDAPEPAQPVPDRTPVAVDQVDETTAMGAQSTTAVDQPLPDVLPHEVPAHQQEAEHPDDGHRHETARSPRASPGSDIDFTATVAAGLADSGFNPNMVIEDPGFQRRASPTGIAEADPQEEDAFVPSISKRKKNKSNKAQKATDTLLAEQEDKTSGQQKARSDVDDIVNKTLESTGFDAMLLDKAMAASDQRLSGDVENDPESTFTTSKRKKNKKGKSAVLDGDDSVRKVSDGPTPVEGMKEAADAIAADSLDRQLTTGGMPSMDADLAPPPITAESTEHGWLVQDEMDVDAMDQAYKAYKKNKRQQKKLKAAAKSAGLGENIEGSAVDDTERSALVSEAEGAPMNRNPTEASSEQQSDAVKDDSKPAQSSTSQSSAKSVVQSVFPSLERVKRRVPTGSAKEKDGKQIRRVSTDSGKLGPVHTSEVMQQHVPEQISADVDPAGVGLAAASTTEQHGTQSSGASHAGTTGEPSWSFAALQDDKAFHDSARNGGDREENRDSGYETAKRSSQPTDGSEGEVPEKMRTSSSRESLRERRSLEPLRVSTPTSPEWNLHTPKQRTGEHNEAPLAMAGHQRMPSANTPLEPTSKNRASYLFQSPPDLLAVDDASTPLQHPEQPSSSPRATQAEDAQEVSGSDPTAHGERFGVSSPTSSRAPLDAIVEEHPERHHSRKRSKPRAEVGGPEHIKAIRRTETPQAIRARERALSPSLVQHGYGSSADEGGLDHVHMHASGSVVSDRSMGSASQLRSPQANKELRSFSRSSNRSSTSTPSLRRISLSGDLRAASRRGASGSGAHGGSDLGSQGLASLTASAVGARATPPTTIAGEAPPTPPLEHDELIHAGASRAGDMNDDVFQGYGDAQQSQVSPTRPPSVRKRQSMHINELESRLDYLLAENRALQEAREASHAAQSVDAGPLQEALAARDLQLQAKDAEIHQIKAMLQPLQSEIARLTELSNALTDANRNLVDDTNGRYATLQAEHAEAHNNWQATRRELESLRNEHGRITSGMRDIVEAELATALADKNAEILRLREQLDLAAEQIRALQVQIQSSKSSDFLVNRDEDYFDGSCQKLCQHVQQWVLRFSKMSDNRVCRLSTELNDDKIEARLDNAVLDGSDVDKLLGDRVRRRDVFMSVVMTMVWEYVFTRYLFGMDREQRQKLKALEKLLSEVGPPRAVAHWRATTLTLLSKRPSFDAQCALDTEAVAHEIFGVLCMLLPPPAGSQDQLQTSLKKVIRIAVDLAIEMRTQRAEYIMLPPLQPEYDNNGDLVRKVYFNASLMNERSGLFSSNEELAARHAVVKMVLFPLVVKKGDDVGEGDDEIVVCPAQVLVHNDGGRDKKIVRVMSGAMEIDGPIRSRQSSRSLMSDAPGSSGL